MTKQILIERTIIALNQLPQEKVEEISDFADFLFKSFEEKILSVGIQKMVSTSDSFEFIINEEEIYTLADLKEVYNG